MKRYQVLVFALLISIIGACGSPNEKKNQADEAADQPMFRDGSEAPRETAEPGAEATARGCGRRR